VLLYPHHKSAKSWRFFPNGPGDLLIGWGNRHLVLQLLRILTGFYIYFYYPNKMSLLRWSNFDFLGQELSLERWNILNYRWDFFRSEIEIFVTTSFQIIFQINSLWILSLYHKWMNCIIHRNILDINPIQVFLSLY
jgi:hypothetical protein